MNLLEIGSKGVVSAKDVRTDILLIYFPCSILFGQKIAILFVADTHFKSRTNGLQDGIDGLTTIGGGNPHLRQVQIIKKFRKLLSLFQFLKNLNQR